MIDIATENDEAADMEWLHNLPSRLRMRPGIVRFKRLLQRIAEASTYDPGEADLDDEQPAKPVSVDLGDVRLARRLLR